MPIGRTRVGDTRMTLTLSDRVAAGTRRAAVAAATGDAERKWAREHHPRWEP